MPSLTDLPQELLFIIARFVGSEYLRSQAGLLVLFREWSLVASIVAYEDLTLNNDTIDGYLKATGGAQKLVQSSVRHLSLTITQFEPSQIPVNEPFRDDQDASHVSSIDDNVPIDSGHTRAISNKSWTCMSHSLDDFAPHLTQMPQLVSFSLELLVYFRPARTHEDTSLASVSAILSHLPKSLSSLVVDHCGSRVNVATGQQANDHHLCILPVKQGLTTRLRQLWIRLRDFCPEIFRSMSSETYPCLESLLINLSLGPYGDSGIYKICYARDCLSQDIMGTNLLTSLIAAGKEAVPSLPCLQACKIMHHSHLGEEIYMYDFIADRNLLYPVNTDWKSMIDISPDDAIESNESPMSEDTISSIEFTSDPMEELEEIV